MKNFVLLQREKKEMIKSRKDYIEYLACDARALGYESSKPKWGGGKPCNLRI